MSKRSNPWGSQKKNQSLKALLVIQACPQDSVSPKTPVGYVLRMLQDFIPHLPENQNQSPRQFIFIDPLVLSHIEPKWLGNKAGSLTIDSGPPQEL